MNVTVTPPAAVPFEVTVATSMLVKASPTVAVCPDPLVAAIVMVGGGGVEELLEELPQPTKKAVVVKARIEAIETAILEWIVRFIETLVSAQPSRWLDHGIAAKRGSRTCFGCVCVAARLDSASSTATFPAGTDAAKSL